MKKQLFKERSRSIILTYFALKSRFLSGLCSAKLVGTLVSILLFNLISTAQTSYPIISQNWTQIFEDESVMMEISAQVIQCDSSSNAIIFLEIFNETPNDDTAKFELTITNPTTGDDETEDITYFIQGARIERPECGSSNNSALRVTIPSGYNPETIKLSVTY